MQNLKYLFLAITFTFLWSCSNCKIENDSLKVNNALKKVSLKEIAFTKYGKNYKIIKNVDNSYAICINFVKIQKAPVTNRKDFFIYDLKEKKILFEKSIVNGKVFWFSDYKVAVSRIPGTIKKDTENKNNHILYYYDVITKKIIN